jgi:RNA polymerase sigma-70 factor, ECF subfamily
VRQVVEEELALRSAWREHGPALYATAVRRLGDRQLAEEVVADAFVRAWRAGHDPARGSLRTFLFAILRNGVVDAARHRAVRPARPVADPVERVAHDHDEVAAVEARLQLNEALRELSDAHRTVLVECHLRDRPYAEVATELGVPVATLRTRMYYGLRALRLALEERGWTDGV